MRVIIGGLLFLSGLALAFWLGICVMLYGGIMQTVENWQVDNSAVVWGIIRAVFFEFGLAAGFIMCVVGASVIDD